MWWDCGIEFCQEHGYLSVVSVVRCQVKSLQRDDPSSRGVLSSVVFPTGCNREDSIMVTPLRPGIYISGEW